MLKRFMKKILVTITGLVLALGFGLLFLHCLDEEAKIQEEKARKYFERYPEMRQVMAQYK